MEEIGRNRIWIKCSNDLFRSKISCKILEEIIMQTTEDETMKKNKNTNKDKIRHEIEIIVAR